MLKIIFRINFTTYFWKIFSFLFSVHEPKSDFFQFKILKLENKKIKKYFLFYSFVILNFLIV